MKKLIISALTVAALLATTSNVFAAVPKYKPQEDGTFTVTHNVGASQAGKYCGVVAVKGTGVLDLNNLTNIVYIDQVQVDNAGNITVEDFGLRTVDESNASDVAYEKSTLYIGGAGLPGATQIAVLNVSGVDEYDVTGKVVNSSSGFGPIAGATVTVTDTEGTEYSTTTGADGSYSVTVPEGEGYTIKYTKNAYCSFTYTGVDVSEALTIADIEMKGLVGDVVTSGQVNANDLNAVLTDFGRPSALKPEFANSNSDVNASGQVNAVDLNAVLGNFKVEDKTVVYTN